MIRRTRYGLKASKYILLGCAVALGGTRMPAMAGADAEEASSSAHAAVRWRVLEPWLDPAGRELFTHGGNVLSWDGMLRIGSDTQLGRYIGQIRAWGFNGIALFCNPEDDAQAFRAFCRYLKPMGIGVFIRRDWDEIEVGKSWPPKENDGRPRTSPKLNPYNMEVRTFWEQRVARDYSMFPDLAGYRMAGTEYSVSNGAPWMGEGPEMRGKTGRECAREAIRLVADELGKHGGMLFWDTSQDDPWGERQEFWYYRDLTGEIPANAIILIKHFYWDFHPGWPRHPLSLVITKDAQGQSPFATSVQLPGEFNGVNDFPWARVDYLAEVMRSIVATGQQGIWVMAEPLPTSPWDHRLNAVNWYGLSTLMLHPQVLPGTLEAAWAKEEYGQTAAGAVVRILNKVSDAALGLFVFDGLWTSAHSRFPTLEYLDSHLCGPYRQTPRMKGMMGLTLPLDMYPPTVEAQIRADPATRLVFNQVPITPQLKSRAMAQKDGAVRSMREAVDLWRSVRGEVSAIRYEEVLGDLEANLNDAIVFQHMMDLYMDWKLGELSETKIDTALAACRGLIGRAVPDPLDPNPKRVTSVEPASLKTFAEQLRRDLRQPWLEEYWRRHPNPYVTYQF